MLTALVFIALLALLVLAHEVGHFVAARALGVRVYEFGFGFPPRLLQLVRGGVTYSLNLLPLGGFVKLKGESGEEANDPDSFAAQVPWRRAMILLSGVVMNVMVTFALLWVGFSVGLPSVVSEEDTSRARDVNVHVLAVVPSTPAALAGIQAGDMIVELNGVAFSSLTAVQAYINDHRDQSMRLRLKRGSEFIDTQATPMLLPQGPRDRAAIGVSLVQAGIVSYPWYEAILVSAQTTATLLVEIVRGFGVLLQKLLTQGGAAVEVAGPVGIAVLTGQVVELGWLYVVQFAALLSANLAVINILPFPALDGGRLLFVGLEKLRRRALDRRVEGLVNYIGFAILMLLIVAVTYQDIARLVSSG